jgi:hypothetical protein
VFEYYVFDLLQYKCVTTADPLRHGPCPVLRRERSTGIAFSHAIPQPAWEPIFGVHHDLRTLARAHCRRSAIGPGEAHIEGVRVLLWGRPLGAVEAVAKH